MAVVKKNFFFNPECIFCIFWNEEFKSGHRIVIGVTNFEKIEIKVDLIIIYKNENEIDISP